MCITPRCSQRRIHRMCRARPCQEKCGCHGESRVRIRFFSFDTNHNAPKDMQLYNIDISTRKDSSVPSQLHYCVLSLLCPSAACDYLCFASYTEYRALRPKQQRQKLFSSRSTYIVRTQQSRSVKHPPTVGVNTTNPHLSTSNALKQVDQSDLLKKTTLAT